MTEDVIIFKPSPWPVIGTFVVLPIAMSLVFILTLSPLLASVSILVFAAFFVFATIGNPLTFLRIQNALGHINSVELSPQGIQHNGWNWIGKPFSYAYTWDDIHSLRTHKVSTRLKMIVFTPVKPEVGKFYRSIIDGSYGVPYYGKGDEMLNAMIDFHGRYAAGDLPSAWASSEPAPRPKGWLSFTPRFR